MLLVLEIAQHITIFQPVQANPLSDTHRVKKDWERQEREVAFSAVLSDCMVLVFLAQSYSLGERILEPEFVNVK